MPRTAAPRRRGWPLRAVLATALLAAALGLGASRAQTPATEGWLALRILALDGERGPIDVWVDGARVLAAVAAGEPTTYVLVPAGARTIEVSAARDDAADADGDGPDAADGDDARRTVHLLEDVAPGSYLTLLLPPAATASGEGEDAAGVLLDDALAALPPAGRAGLRLVHAAPAVGRVALVRRDPDLRYDAPPLFESSDDGASGHLARLGPLEASDHAILPPGETALWLVREGGEPGLAEPLEAPLRAGTLYTLYLVPTGDGAVRGRLAVDATAPLPAGGGN